jgi:hypothetical protein
MAVNTLVEVGASSQQGCLAAAVAAAVAVAVSCVTLMMHYLIFYISRND